MTNDLSPGAAAMRPTRPTGRAHSALTLGPGASLAFGERRDKCTD